MLKHNKFICDVMLGKLAKWLWLFGYDTLYEKFLDDLDLLEIAVSEDRILLTRDTKLYKTAGSKRTIFIKSELFREQLIQMKEFIEIEIRPVHCPICNGRISKIAKKEQVNHLVPEYTYKTHDIFYQCQNCSKIYWNGSHQELAEDFLKELVESQ